MRFTAKKKGDERVRTYFALIPVQIGDDVRWFEKVTVREKYESGWDYNSWRAVEFMDKKKSRFDIARTTGSQKE